MQLPWSNRSICYTWNLTIDESNRPELVRSKRSNDINTKRMPFVGKACAWTIQWRIYKGSKKLTLTDTYLSETFLNNELYFVEIRYQNLFLRTPEVQYRIVHRGQTWVIDINREWIFWDLQCLWDSFSFFFLIYDLTVKVKAECRSTDKLTPTFKFHLIVSELWHPVYFLLSILN